MFLSEFQAQATFFSIVTLCVCYEQLCLQLGVSTRPPKFGLVATPITFPSKNGIITWNSPFRILFQQASAVEQAVINSTKCGHFEVTRNSSGDEIANVNFLYHIVHVLPLAIRHLANNNHTTALAAVQCVLNERGVPHFNALARGDPLPISP